MKGDSTQQNIQMNIRAVTQATGLTAHTLRYYEQIGLLNSIARDAGGRRRYTARDLDWIAFLQRLRALGMPIREMCDYAALRREGDSTAAARRALLQKHLDRIQQEIRLLADSADMLKAKIEYYHTLEASSSPTPSTQENKDDERKIRTRAGQTQ